MIIPGFIFDSASGFVKPPVLGYGFRLYGSTSGSVGFLPSAIAGSQDYILPSVTPTSGQLLSSDSSGNLSWVTIAGSLPSQTGNNGLFLTTNGTDAFWAALSGNGSAITNLNASNLSSGTVNLSRLTGITTTQLSSSAGIINSQLENSSITINTGSGLSGGGSVSLGGSITLSATSSGAVSSVSNSDGTLTISPTTGSVVASINLTNSNAWGAQQSFTSATFSGNISTINNVSYVWPVGQASEPTVLTNDGSGNLSWSAGGGGGAVGSNPTAVVGLTVVDGSSASFMRSDGAPALSQSISPTWTGVHTFSSAPTIKILDSSTSTISTLLTIGHASTGTPGIGFGSAIVFNLNSATVSDRSAAKIYTKWTTATDSGRKSSLVFQTIDNNNSSNPTDAMTIDGDGNVSAVGTLTGSNFTGFTNPSVNIGLSAVNGSATTAMRSDAAPALSQSITPIMTGNWTFAQNGIGITSTDAVVLSNSTAATNNNQQWSGRLRLTSQSWETGSSASQTVDFIQENQSIQGTTASGLWVLSSQINGAGYNQVFNIDSSGNVNTIGVINAATHINGLGNIRAGAAESLYWNTRSTMWSPSDGVILLQNQASNAFSALQFGGITSSFSQIGISGTTLKFQLADASADCPITAGGAIFSGNISASNFSGSSSGINTGDQTSISGNAATATALQTARTINGVSFDGTSNITVPAAAGTLTGTTLNSTVVSSSLTSIGTLSAGSIPFSLITGGPAGSNPSANVGLTVVNGSATTFLRSDAAPALDQTITPTWTGEHTWAIGSITTSKPQTFTQTWNAGGITFTGILENITDTTSASGSLLIDLQVGGTSQFKVDKLGNLTAVGTLTGSNFTGFTNPSVNIGLSAVNGSATTAMRSDAAPALSQSIVPSWTGLHTFTNSSGIIITQGVATSGSPNAFLVTGGAHTTLTASTESTDINLNLSRTVQFSTGTLTTQRAVRIQAPTYTFVASSTLTNYSTVDISGGATAGTNATITNNYALTVGGAASPTFAVGSGGNLTKINTVSYVWPSSQGGGSTLLENDGSGNLSWTTIAIGPNPSANVGLTAVNGTSASFMRSDGAPALSQGIIPTWTGLHTFNNGITVSGTTTLNTALSITSGGTGQTSANAAFNALSPMTTSGDIIYGGTSGVGTRLAGNITTTREFLRQVGNGSAAGAPMWDTVTKTDVGLSNVENTALSTWAGSTNLTTLGTITTGIWNGTKIGLLYGGTNADLSSTGGSGQYLKQSSTGANITVGTIAAADLPGSFSGFANPVNPGVNLTGANGSATTALRSDAVHILDQSIAPTWSGIHTFTNITPIIVSQSAASSGSPTAITITGGSHTSLASSTEATFININGAQTVQFSVGNITTQRTVRLQAQTYTFAGSSVITNATTFDISGAPIAGTNATITNNYALTVGGPASPIFSVDASGNVKNGTWLGTAIAIANGGTGQTSANAAFNALAPSQTSNSGKFLTTGGTNTSWAAAAASVSNSDGTLTISPTTGAVIASLALGHANTWTATQIINLNAAGAPTGSTGTGMQIVGTDSTIARVEVDAFGSNAAFTTRRADGTGASPTALLSAETIGAYNWHGYNGSAYTSAQASISALTTENWTGSNNGTQIVIKTTPTGTTTLTTAATFGQDQSLIIAGNLSGINTVSYVWPSSQGGGSTVLTNDGLGNLSWSAGGGGSGANPSATIGLSAVNGSATTFLRSDGAPALSQSITPTWTGLHTFAVGTRTSGSARYFVVQTPADTGLTASTECIGTQYGGNSSAATVSRQFATGALTTQRENVIVAPTYAFVGASTITNTSTLDITNAPIAGTNATLTNSYALTVGGPASPKFSVDGTGNTTCNRYEFATEYSNGNSGSSITINFNNGGRQSVTLNSASVAITFSNGKVGGMQLKIIQDSSGSRTALFTGCLASNGQTPNLTTAANAIDVLGVYYDGTNYIIALSAGNLKTL